MGLFQKGLKEKFTREMLNFSRFSRKAVIDAVAKVRKQRGSLSGLSLENIIERAKFFIEKKRNRVNTPFLFLDYHFNITSIC